MNFGKEWRAGLMVGLVVGGAGGWVASTWPGLVIATSAKNWWDIAAALGTIGATLGAVGIASWQYRITRRERWLQARQAAANHFLVSQEIATRLSRDAATLLKLKDESPPENSILDDLIASLRDIRNEPMFSDAVCLSALGRRVAEDITGAAVRIDAGISNLRMFRRRVELNDDLSNWTQLSSQLHAALLHAAKDLRSVSVKCGALVAPWLDQDTVET